MASSSNNVGGGGIRYNMAFDEGGVVRSKTISSPSDKRGTGSFSLGCSLDLPR